MAKPGSQTTKPTLSAAGEATERDEEEVIDLDAFQAALDESVQSVRAMVDSWMPKDLGPQWNQPSGRTQLSGPVLRPPRLGLGASATAYHAQAAEELKLRRQLLPSKKKRAANGQLISEEKEAVATASSSSRSVGVIANGIRRTNGLANGNGNGHYMGNAAAGSSSSEDDEEESRSHSIKVSAPSVVATSSFSDAPRKKQKVHVQSLISIPSSSLPTRIPPRTHSVTSPSLTTVESTSVPAEPISAASLSIKTTSFYGTTIATLPTTTNGTTPSLSKGQRKKMREKEKSRIRRDGAEAEVETSQIESDLGNTHGGDASAAIADKLVGEPDSPQGRKKKKKKKNKQVVPEPVGEVLHLESRD